MFEHSHKYISTYAIPFVSVLYTLIPKLRGNLIPHLIPMSIIGSFEVLLQNRSRLETFLIIVGHLLVFPLITFIKPTRDYGTFIDVLLLVLALGLVRYIPTWEYKITRQQIMCMYSIIFLGILNIRIFFQ